MLNGRYGEIGLDRPHQAAGQFLLVGAPLEQAFFLQVRQATEFDENRRDIRCGQNGEVRGALRVIEQHDLARQLVDDLAGECN